MTTSRSWIGAGLALGACALGAAVAAQPARAPGPRVIGPLALEGEVEDCAGCHAEIAAEWSSSAHARSWTDPVFQAEHAPAPQAFCRGCHAPRASGEEVGAAAARGIDCAVCHVREGRVLGRHGRGAERHPIRVEASLGETRFCGPCHEFDFPAREPGAPRPTYLPGRPLQSTLSEHARSAARDRTCQDCHMPRRGDHVDHRFPGLGDPALMRRAVTTRVRVRSAARGGLRVDVELRPGEIGHAFPTGDMFRQGRFEVRRGRHSAVEPLTRWFSRVPGDDAFYLAEVDDTRVPPDGPLSFSLALPPGQGPVRWRLDVWRLDPETARRRGLSEELVRVPVASGHAAPR